MLIYLKIKATNLSVLAIEFSPYPKRSAEFEHKSLDFWVYFRWVKWLFFGPFSTRVSQLTKLISWQKCLYISELKPQIYLYLPLNSVLIQKDPQNLSTNHWNIWVNFRWVKWLFFGPFSTRDLQLTKFYGLSEVNEII